MIAERFGYSSVLSGDYLLFARTADRRGLKFIIARILLNRVVCRLLRGIILIMPAPGAWRDHLSAKSK